LVLSADILEEYQRVGQVLGAQYSGVDLEPPWDSSRSKPRIVEAPDLPEPVSCDPDDDKSLLDHAGWRGLPVLRPRRSA